MMATLNLYRGHYNRPSTRGAMFQWAQRSAMTVRLNRIAVGHRSVRERRGPSQLFLQNSFAFVVDGFIWFLPHNCYSTYIYQSFNGIIAGLTEHCECHCASVTLNRMDTQSEMWEVSSRPVHQTSNECNKELRVPRRINVRLNVDLISEMTKILSISFSSVLRLLQ
jgi:hypothetical protein